MVSLLNCWEYKIQIAMIYRFEYFFMVTNVTIVTLFKISLNNKYIEVSLLRLLMHHCCMLQLFVTLRVFSFSQRIKTQVL
jgi:hypothetical protein